MAHKPPATRSDYVVFRTLQTRWNDNDVYGHVNNAVHYLMFDTAVNGWLLDNGLLQLKHPEIVFIVAETACKYHAEIVFPDVIHAGMRIEHLGRSSVVWQIGIFRNDVQTAAAEGRFVHVHVRRQGLKSVPMPVSARGKLQPLVR
ncbi:MAG: acyl-CoA thioesterase [Rhodobacteraceae bacterium]|nr:acyl-CoA thioesterase [Paracoccaceae bacterium]